MDFFRFLGSKRFLKHLLGMVVIMSVFMWMTLLGLRVYTQHGKYYVVPDYTGKKIDEVMTGSESAVFDFVVIDSVFDVNREKGTVLHQDPYPDSKVKKDRKIYLTVVSMNPEKTSMPDLKFLTLRQAISTLESCGLKRGRIVYIPTFDADAVQQQRYNGNVIAAGTHLDKGSMIDLTVGIGAKAEATETGVVKEDSL